MTKGNLEVEMKWLIDRAGHQSILEHLPQQGEILHQTNHFFDSSTGTLRSKGWALRCRQENEALFLTCKGPSTRCQDGLSSRTEIEGPTTLKVLEQLMKGAGLEDIDHPSADHLRSLFGDLHLVPTLVFSNQRRRLPWNDAILELDHCSCRGVHRYELEIEGAEEQLLLWAPSLELALQQWGIDFKRASDSKLRWATGLFEITQ